MRDQCRVLIVDDNEDLAENILEILEDEGMDGAICCTAEKALGVLREDADYDLVITDFKMPRMNGLEFLREVKEHWPELPVVLLSAYMSAAEAAGAEDSGALAIMRKPQDLERLVDTAKQIEAGRA